MSYRVNKDVLKPKARDAFPTLAQTTLTTISPPLGFVAGLMQIYLGDPASRRVEEFLISIDERLTECEQSSLIDKDKLLQDPKFNTIVMHATQIAIRNHQKEKLDALRNAVLNSSLPNSPEEDKQLIFLRILDSLTVFDLKVLVEFCKYPKSPWVKHAEQIIINSYVENGVQKELVLQSIMVLSSNGLFTQIVSVTTSNKILSKFNPTQTQNNISSTSYCINQLGIDFLQFIGISS